MTSFQAERNFLKVVDECKQSLCHLLLTFKEYLIITWKLKSSFLSYKCFMSELAASMLKANGY